MKKVLLSILFLASFTAAFCQISPMKTPKEYAVNSGKPFDADYQLGRFWYVIHFENGNVIYCHNIRCNGNNYIAVFEVTEMPTGAIIEKELYYKNEDVKYTSVLR